MESMSYPIINEIVVKSDAELSAAQAHGMATGMLCVNEQTQSDTWLAEFFLHGAEVDNNDLATLEDLFEITQSQLTSDDFDFDLLLPSDDESLLSEQVEALSYWCQGFLMGISFAHDSSEWSKEATEILKDIVEFTKLDTEVEGEEDESDFMEISEYIRSAVLLLRSEINTLDERPKTQG